MSFKLPDDNVYLRLLGTGADRYVCEGPVTRTRYSFDRFHGTLVDPADVESMLNMTSSNSSCCGSPSIPSPVFEVYQ